jgi:hypothetical protein
MRSVFTSLVVVALASIAACGSLSSRSMVYNEPNEPCTRPTITDGWLDANLANRIVSFTPEHCQSGAFGLTVKSVARVGSVMYLNSEVDFHDPRNITVAVLPEARDEMARFFHDAPDNHLLNKQIFVVGTVRRVQVPITTYGPTMSLGGGTFEGFSTSLVPTMQVGNQMVSAISHPGANYYFLSHVLVEEAGQIFIKSGNATK